MTCDECANFEPKRKQTGWICRRCRKNCVIQSVELGAVFCPYNCMITRFVPFTGKVVE